MRVSHHDQLSLFSFRHGVMTEAGTQGTSRDARAAVNHTAALLTSLKNSVLEVPESTHHPVESDETESSPFLPVPYLT